MSGWSILFWLIVLIILLYPLNRWITTHVQGVAFLLTGSKQLAMWLFWTLFLPGTFLHELSHWLTAHMLGAKPSGFSMWPTVKRKGELQMGAVQVQVTDPFRHSLIGLAPLLSGSLIVLLIGHSRLGLEQTAIAFNNGDIFLLAQTLRQMLTVADVWLWLYLIFAISNAMLPSASDREAWWSVALYLTLTLLLLVGLGLNPTLSPQLQDIGLMILASLLSAFIITIAVDILFIIVIIFVEILASRVLRRQMRYIK